MINKSSRVLVASPVRQSPFILKECLYNLARIDCTGIELDYLFVNDNVDELSFKLLNAFGIEGSKTIIWDSDGSDNYVCDEDTHHWDNKLFTKVADFKNRMIKYMIDEKYDFIFFIDSDILIRPETVKHLINQDKEIISEVFWTKWKNNTVALPQVWLYDQTTMHDIDKFSDQKEGVLEFLRKISKPGVYEVGGLGACTLIKRSALEKGIDFSPIYNIRYLRGEDRYFCVRAAVHGVQLYVDTHYPAYHIYRLSELDGVEAWRTDLNYCDKFKV